jgi:hypothetical protein
MIVTYGEGEIATALQALMRRFKIYSEKCEVALQTTDTEYLF